MTEKRKPGRPKGKNAPMLKRSISVPVETLARIDKDRGAISRSKFLLNRAGYGGKS